MRFRGYLYLFVIIAAALILRIYGLRFFPMPDIDSIGYLRMSKAFMEEGFSKMGILQAPLYPILASYISSIFGIGLEKAATSISIVSSLVFIIVLTFMITSLYGRSAAYITALICAMHPYFLTFSLDIEGTMLYITFSWLSLFLFWKALKNNVSLYFLLSGLFLGFGYLTRNETFVWFLLMLIWGGFLLLKKGIAKKKLILSLLIFFFSFSALSFPYIKYISKILGYWTISAKDDVVPSFLAKNRQKYFYGLSKDLKKCQAEFMFTGFFPESRHRVNFFDFLRENFLHLILHFMKNVYRVYLHILPFHHLPPFLLLLCFYGLLKKGKRYLNYDHMFFLFFFIAFLAFSSLIVASPRYAFILLPFFFLLIGSGCEEFSRSFKNKTIAHFLLSSLSIIFILPSSIAQLKWVYKTQLPHELKKAGIWLKNYEKREEFKVMSRKQWVAYFAEAQPVPLPLEEFEKIIKYATYKKVDYIVISGRYIHLTPSVKFLLFPSLSPPYLKPVYYDNSKENKEVVIYKLKYE
jgi:4-amino-4-deoxy-L-arabinose transferase-like glycosyltransferase